MSDNNTGVVLITRDPRLKDLVTRQRPPLAQLRCLAPAELKNIRPPAAEQWWIDLDAGACPELGECRRRVYFYSRLPLKRHQLPTGLFLRKPCGAPAIAVLWAGLSTTTHEPLTAMDAENLRRPAVLPAWVFELHRIELSEFSHRCVERLPARLGYAEIALYLHDSAQDLLLLAETNSKRCVDLAIPLGPENQHALAVVARSGRPLSTNDLAGTCRAKGMNCPGGLESEPDHAALIVPLISDGRLRGLLQLNDRRGTDVSEVGLPLAHLFAFLARCLEHARQYERAHVEARVDRLTGMYNYRWLLETLGREIRRSQRYDNPLALIMLDLDGLKPVNDRFGHSAGDALLRHVARKVSATLRQIDSGARIGGDEFVVLLPATDLAGARQVGQRILAAIRDDAPLIDRRPLPVAASLGVAQWEDGWDEKRLLAAADGAMYAAKGEGHNQVVCHPHQAPTSTVVAAPVPHVE